MSIALAKDQGSEILAGDKLEPFDDMQQRWNMQQDKHEHMNKETPKCIKSGIMRGN